MTLHTRPLRSSDHDKRGIPLLETGKDALFAPSETHEVELIESTFESSANSTGEEAMTWLISQNGTAYFITAYTCFEDIQHGKPTRMYWDAREADGLLTKEQEATDV